MRLGEILARRGRATAAAIDSAWTRRAGEGRRIGEALVAEGLVTERDVLDALAEQTGLSFLSEIPDEALDPALVARLPVEWARGRVLLPVRREGRLLVLMDDPAKVPEAEELALLLGAPVEPALAPRGEILQAIERCYVRRADSPGALLREMAETPPGAAEAPSAGGGAEDLLRMAEGAPVTRLVNAILLEAVQSNASDIHLEPFENHLRVRCRMDGLLYDRPAPPKHLEAPLVSRLKVMARLDIAEKRLPQDGMARVRVGTREIDVRVSSVPVAEGERLVLRLLRRDSAVLPLSELGMGGRVAEAFRRLLALPQGIVLVTGPTGSGKTTTLYAALRELDTNRLNVMTIEDPIEYQLPSISQIQVNPRIELTFARCLRHVLRQDPDVILVGETRDLETAEIAIRASLTGHLVFSTLHTNDAAGAALRLVDMGVPSYLLADALRGVLAQRLVRRLCPHCRVEAVLTAEDLAPWGAAARGFAGRRHFRARGCDRCREGYAGRIGVFELVALTPAVAEAIRSGARPEPLRAAAAAAGFATLAEDGLARVLEGATSLAELGRVLGAPGAPA